jgi:transposase-like protein
MEYPSQALGELWSEPKREKLGPVVEVDKSYYGGYDEGKPGRGGDKALIVLAVELDSDRKIIGRIRIKLIPDSGSDSLIPFIIENAKPGATVLTDGWKSYCALKDKGFDHEVIRSNSTDDLLPHVHLVFSLLKRWILGTYQGGPSQDLFVFRFNHRKSKHRGKLFRRLMEQAVLTLQITMTDIKSND